MRPPKFTPRADYRAQENLRVRESINLSEKFPRLKSLTVELEYFNSEGVPKNSHIKYTVNPAHAKSVFRFDCLNPECVGGDYDLSDGLSGAIAAKQSVATGEMVCKGWMSKTTIDRLRCGNILRYKLTLAYSNARPRETAVAARAVQAA